jgi:hypothetical protein
MIETRFYGAVLKDGSTVAIHPTSPEEPGFWIYQINGVAGQGYVTKNEVRRIYRLGEIIWRCDNV